MPASIGMVNEPSYSIIRCYDSQVLPRYRIQKKYSDAAYTCWYIRHGSVGVETMDGRLLAHAGDWVFIEPLTVKSHAFSHASHIISIRFTTNWNNLHFFPPLQRPWTVSGNAAPSLLTTAARFCSWEMGLEQQGMNLSPSTYARRSELFSAWLYQWHSLRESTIERPPFHIDPRVAKVLTELMRAPGITPVDYKQLQQITSLSQAQISRLFRQATGQSVKEWQNAVCLKIAEKLLVNKDVSIKEIAARLHFNDASHFSKWFRNQIKQTPGQWRKDQSLLPEKHPPADCIL